MGDSSHILLELSASNDLLGFKAGVEERGLNVDEASFWYGRKFGSKKMGYEQRTPLMIAAMYGSLDVLKYIVDTCKVDVNRACGSDKVTALYCAVAGGSSFGLEIVKILLDASADAKCTDANGRKPSDLISMTFRSPLDLRRKPMELLLKGTNSFDPDGERKITTSGFPKEGGEKKEFPVDVSLPDINTGIYATDEFRMYSFKVKTCSRAYSHDWTECPFVHPGENARRRDPRKYPYSCVPCPEFRKGTCQKGDSCEYAHGVFESWLHPAQYRTRLCKDEIGCARRVCFFAHKPEELRHVNASTGSAIPSAKSPAASALNMTALSPMHQSSSLSLPIASTPPMSALAVSSSPGNGNLWQNKTNHNLPALQLPGSRLKTTLSARDLDLEMELLRMESLVAQQQKQQQQLMDELLGLSSPSYGNKEFSRTGELKPTNLNDVFDSFSPTYSRLHGFSSTPRLQSPTRPQTHQILDQIQPNYPRNLASSPVRTTLSPFGFDSSGAAAAAVMNCRSAALTRRSQSFMDRGALSHCPIPTVAGNSITMMPSKLSDWSPTNGKLDWGIQANDMNNKLRKCASFGFQSNDPTKRRSTQPIVDEPDVSWVHSLVKDVSHLEK